MKKDESKKTVDFRLIVIAAGHDIIGRPPEEIIEVCCKSGVKAFQLRDKDMTAGDLLKLAQALKKITKKYTANLIINDRLDIALSSKADGLHSPENGISSKDVKRIDNKLLLGRSVHLREAAIDAGRSGFDYIIFGPVYRTSSKIKFGKPQGLKKLKEVCKAVDIPVFAIGGITPARAKKCIEHGAHGTAVISAVTRSANIMRTISEFKRALGSL
ncbi:MAG: thiamine phosphate synthase [Ignavibacteria bacterium]|jgi:thiamine-phosphate pyrophosphorylase